MIGKYFSETRYVKVNNWKDSSGATQIGDENFSKNDLNKETLVQIINFNSNSGGNDVFSVGTLVDISSSPKQVCCKKKDKQIVVCSSDACAVKNYHRSCLFELRKKSFNKNWICDNGTKLEKPTKTQLEKPTKRQPL